MPEYDELVAEADTNPVWEERVKLYEQAEQVMIDQGLIVPLVHPIITAVVSDDISRSRRHAELAGLHPARSYRQLPLLAHQREVRGLNLLPGLGPGSTPRPFPSRNRCTMRLVEIKGLKVSFAQHGGEVEAVRGVSFTLNEGESLGIVGESGSGKSVTCMALMRLLGDTASGHGRQAGARRRRRADGEQAKTSRRLRGRSAAMIFQDPVTAFDPVFTIGHQIVETIRTHRGTSKREALAEAEQLLQAVEIKNATDVLGYYPHQLSGGMLQRAMIAMALSCRPKLLIADEPTTALDVTIQAQILQLIKELQAEMGMALIMITHDLGVIAETVDRVVVMYGGQVMEEGPVAADLRQPQAQLHPVAAGEPDGRRRARLEPRRAGPASRRRSNCATSPRSTSCAAAAASSRRYVDFHAVRGVNLVAAAQQDRRPRRRIRFGQEHDRHDGDAADRADRRPDRGRWHRYQRTRHRRR